MNKTSQAVNVVGIAGVGGVGSNVAAILARTGGMNLKIIDFDHVESSNLNRQFYFASQVGKPKVDMLEHNLKKIDPDIKVNKEIKKITRKTVESDFKECKIVVEGFDLKESKIMLLEEFVGKKDLIVSASGIAGDDMTGIQVKKIEGNCYIVGDYCSEENVFDIFPPKVFSIAALMAGIVLKYIKKVRK